MSPARVPSLRLLLVAAALANGSTAGAAEAADLPASGAAGSHREVDTDPCSFVEGPFTLERGRAQLELDLFSYARNRCTADGDRQRTDTFVWSGLIGRVALTADCELQVLHDGYVRTQARDDATGSRTGAAGWGDTTLRLKRNLFGNDHGRFALAAAAFALLPTGHRDISAGRGAQGATLAFAASLASGAAGSLDSATQIVWHHSRAEDTCELGQSLLYTRTLSERHSLTVELNLARAGGSGAAWLANSCLNWSWALSERLVLDSGVNLGLSRVTDDFVPYLRLTRWF